MTSGRVRARTAPAPRWRIATVLAGVALMLAGCRIDVGTEVAFDRAGGGEVAVSVRIDGATLRELDRAGVDPGLAVAVGLGPTTAWRPQRSIDADGGLVLTYRQAFRDGAAATELLRELSADVAPQDPAVRLDLTVVTTPTGAVRAEGTAVLVPPGTLGVSLDGDPVGPVGAELAALVADAVRAELVVRVPGRVVTHDADRIDGTTLRWTVPLGEPRPVTLVADAVPLWRRLPGWSSAAVPIVAAGALVWRARRARRPAEDVGAEGFSPAG